MNMRPTKDSSGRAFLLVAAASASMLLMGPAASADEWPQWRGPSRDGVWKETGILKEFPGPRLAPRWRVPLSPGYTGPTVANGKVYVMDRQTEPAEVERVLCFDWQTGKPLWTRAYPCHYEVSYPAGPRASVSIDEGRAYALGTMGHFHCYNAATGEVLWAKDFRKDYDAKAPVWGISGSPLVEGPLVIAQAGGARGSCVVALDKKTGAEQWRALDDQPSYSSPIMVEQANRRVVVCWTGESVAGLDSASGKVLWRYPAKQSRMIINVSTPVIDQDRLLLTSFWDGTLLLRLRQDQPGVEKLWQRRGPSEMKTDALHSIISTPLMDGEFIYGVDSYGELRCLNAKTGDRLWEDLTAVPKARWATIHMVRHEGQVWMFNERGELLIAELSPKGFKEISRTKLLEPTTEQLSQRGGVCWSHPAFAYRHVFARNDREMVCASLEAK